MTRPRVLIACEESGRVRDAFRAQGIDAVSCDIDYDSETPGPHYRGDVRDLLGQPWDALIAFPPCTHLASAGAGSMAAKRADGRQAAALDFVRLLWDSPIALKAIENPVGVLSTQWRKPTQYVQPWQFGHAETKKTCLWLDGLPPLVPNDDAAAVHAHMLTLPVSVRNRVWYMRPSPDRARLRSQTYPGIAAAMARQWAPVIVGRAAAA